MMARWLVLVALALALLTIAGAVADETEAPRHSPYLAGQFLIATPALQDPRFRETVIYMIDHDSDGAFGLIINKPMGVQTLADLLEGVGVDGPAAEGEVTLYFGGPVERAKGFILHSPEYVSPRTRRLSDGLSMSGDKETVQAIARGEGPERFRMIFGYAGWGAGQLDGELARGDWISAPGMPDQIFEPDDATKWQRIRAGGGIAL